MPHPHKAFLKKMPRIKPDFNTGSKKLFVPEHPEANVRALLEHMDP
jgi:hypothetical protein